MRLIDADKELEKYNQRLLMLLNDLAELEQLKAKEPDNPYHDWDKEIASVNMQIDRAKAKIRAFEMAKTAYDVDKVVRQLKKEKERSYYDGTSRRNGKSIAFGESIAYQKAINMVKAGGVDE